MNDQFDNLSLSDLFRLEVENHRAVLNDALIAFERGERSPEALETLMRSAHSIKGAARIVNRGVAVDVAHAMESCFVAAQRGKLEFSSARIDTLLDGVDLINQIALSGDAEIAAWTETNRVKLDGFCEMLNGWLTGAETAAPAAAAPFVPAPPIPGPGEAGEVHQPQAAPAKAAAGNGGSNRSLRVTANNLNRLLALAGESKVASKWLDEFAKSFVRLKHQGRKIAQSGNAVRRSVEVENDRAVAGRRLGELEQQIADLNRSVSEQLQQLDLFERRFLNLSSQLYDEVLNTRMRPFSDGAREFPRMVRDVARSLGKEASLELSGGATPADREVLEKIEAPLTHLLRNAIDHGIESPDERRRRGKPAVGTVRLEARHSSGMLLITVQDDGRGIDPEMLRKAVVEKKLTTPQLAANMSEAELFEFLFLPGFTLRSQVTEISGRGVGLDIVQTMLKEVGGRVRISSVPGKGAAFHLELPLTLSVIRTLLVDVGGEGYAFPLTRLTSVQKVSQEQIRSVQSRQYFDLDGEEIGLVFARQVFDLDPAPAAEGDLSVVVLGERSSRFGVVVDALCGERELVVLPMDERLGKMRNISAAALMPDRTPVLIVDVDDIVRSIEKVVSTGQVSKMKGAAAARAGGPKRILVVDDSLTVRELERKLLEQRGYEVDIAVDGMDGWNAVRTSQYDLVVSDVDMPRMDGIELVSLIKRDASLTGTPVMIVSYKDREEDRQRGLEAGASYYLTKASFHDETLLQAVADLIGEAAE